MIKKQHFTIIALIALIAFIVMPAAAYDQVGTFTLTNNGGGGHVRISFQNTTLANSVTRILTTHTNITAYQNNPPNTYNLASGSKSGILHEGEGNGAAHCGNWSMSWTCTPATFNTAYINDCDIELLLSDQDGSCPATMYYSTIFDDNPAVQPGFIYNGAMQHNSPPANWYACLGDPNGYCPKGTTTVYTGTSVVIPVASFTCTPTSQTVNNGVVCTDTSTNTPTDWYWTLDMDSIGYNAWQTSTARNFTWYSNYIGTYGINLRANNSAGSDWENKSSYVTIYNSTTIQNTVTLTPSPNTCDPGDLVTFTTTCSNAPACTGPNGMHLVSYTEHFPTPSLDFRQIAIYHYNTTSAGWDYRVLPTDPWQVGSYNPLTGARATPTISGDYTYYVSLSKDNYVSLGQGSATVHVEGSVSGSLNMRFDSQDQTTGGHLSNTQMNLTNDNTLDRTEWGIVPDFKMVSLPRGQDYTVRCSKTGYIDGDNKFSVPMNPDIEDGDMGTFVSCPLYPTGSISAGNTTVTVKVFDAENYMPLPNVQVQMSAPVIYTSSPKYTGGDGSGVFFVLGHNQPYYVTASKTGYCAVTETGNTSTLSTKNVYINLKYGTCLGPTPTHTPIPGLTPTPSIIVTPTQFQPGNATSFWTPWINVFTHMGAGAGEINMLLAGLIIVLLMGVGAGMAGVLGAEVAMGFGAIFCVAIGLIPIWVVLAIIILGFLFYGLKIGR